MGRARILGQAAAYAAFGAAIVVLSHVPYRAVPPDAALIQVSIAHAGARLAPCRKLTEAELAARAPNMRAPLECPRGRSPVRVVVEVDGRPLLDETSPPTGFARDGASIVYRRIPVAAGSHRLRVMVSDDLRAPQRAAERIDTVRLEPGRVLSVDYQPERGGILLL